MNTSGKAGLWAGRVLSGLVAIVMLLDGAVMLFAPGVMAPAMAKTGSPLELAPIVGGLAVACAVLYAIPKTAVLGAVLLTGFLGGALCTHLRIGEMGSPPQVIALLIGVLAWGGLYLRDARVRALLPLVR